MQTELNVKKNRYHSTLTVWWCRPMSFNAELFFCVRWTMVIQYTGSVFGKKRNMAQSFNHIFVHGLQN